MVQNRHERVIVAPAHDVGALINSLSSKNDLLWPRGDWPAMRLDGPLGTGSAGGHGPVRYVVSAFEPGRYVEFRFTRPSGFRGSHAFTATPHGPHRTLLRHEISMTLRGAAVFTWPLFFRPMHDALIEEGLDRAERTCGTEPGEPHRRSLWVQTLRALFSGRLTG